MERDDYQRAAKVVQAIGKWMRVRETTEYGKKRPLDTARTFDLEATHSLRGGLLAYILDGNEPHEHPPPLYMSRPWHHLIDQGAEGVKGHMPVWRKEDLMPGKVSIGQHAWDFVEELGENDWVIRYPNLPLYRITRHPDPEWDQPDDSFGLWHLRPYVPELWHPHIPEKKA